MPLILPLAYGLVFGEEERYGTLDADGYFQEADPRLVRPRVIEPLGGDLGLLLPCAAEVLDPAGNPVAVLQVGVVNGRIACISITANPGAELTGQLLRSVPVASLIREVARNHVVHIREGFAVRFVADEHLPETPKRRVLDGAFLQRVADIYRQAVASGLSTQGELQRQLGPVSDAGARRWVVQARREGYLGPALGRKAGEIHGDS